MKTTLQKIRTSNGLSQSQLSTLSGVNLRTLQDFEQGRKPLKNAKGEMIYRLSSALNCSIYDLLTDSVIDIDSTIDKDRAKRLYAYFDKVSSPSFYGKYYSFPVIVPKTRVDMQRVYPTKQHLIYKLHQALYSNDKITSIMLFGSSITMQCHSKSDTDLAIRLKQEHCDNETKNVISEIVQEICEWKADIIWFDRLSKNDRIYHDICKGVQIV